MTPLGRLLGAITALGGIALFALPASILASGFIVDAQQRAGGTDQICPHCGRPLDDWEGRRNGDLDTE